MMASKKCSNLLPLDAYCGVATSSDQHDAELLPENERDSTKRKSDFEEMTSSKKQQKEKSIDADQYERNNGMVEKEEDLKSASGIKSEKRQKESRELEEGELPEDADVPSANPNTSVITKTVPIDFSEFNRKRKVALLLSYCGAGYHGMQKNPDVETIELKLMEAFCAVGAISKDHKYEFMNNNQNHVCYQRAARTDKGVSAARQVVSLKILANESFIEDVNKHLPQEIRVFAFHRVTKSFDAKCSCSGRSYEYLVPSFAFAPSKDIMDPSYRLPDSQLKLINDLLQNYIGTHNFHNYTSGKRFTDKSAVRYITGFKACNPLIVRGQEFIAIEVSGQSFMIHQIRKMIGLVIAICRNYCTIDVLNQSWKELKLDIPKAPGLGLLLNKVYYNQYNKKFCSSGERNPLTWEEADLEVEKFKIEKIWHSIIDEEIKKSSLVQWLKTLNNHTYSAAGMKAPMDAEYKGVTGVFPRNNPVIKSGNTT